MDDDRRVGEVPERACVVHVQVGLDDVAHRAWVDDSADLRRAVLVFGHMDPELVDERAPVGARVLRDRERVAAVDDDVAVGVADQEVRDRHLDVADDQRAAVEQVQFARHRLRAPSITSRRTLAVVPGCGPSLPRSSPNTDDSPHAVRARARTGISTSGRSSSFARSSISST